MIRKIKLVKDSVDTIIPERELKRIKNKDIERESTYRSMLSKIKALMSLKN